ncbi:MAG: penicillin acylase family protein [Pseudomonadota bacterium]
MKTFSPLNTLMASCLATALMSAVNPASAQILPEVMGVFAPGQGAQSAPTTPTAPSAFDSQRDMFASLVEAAPTLKDADLLNHYHDMSFDPLPADAIASVIRPRPDVVIVRDKAHYIPRVKGESREAAMFGAGYARAQDRLWQMDVNRHLWRASLVSFLGRGENDEHLHQDLIVAQRNDYSEDELALMFDQLSERYGKWGGIVQSDLKAYVAGINAYIASLDGQIELTPVEYTERSLTPQDWRVTDFIAEAAHGNTAYFRGYGKVLGLREIGNARLLQQLQAEYGEEAGRAVYDDFRNRNDPDAPALTEQRHDIDLGPDDPAALALPDLNSFELLNPLGGFTAYAENDDDANLNGRSNALIVSGEHTTTGRPISVQGPQDGFSYPHFYNSEIQIVAPDLAAHGLLELGGPYPFNGGRGETFAVSLTSQFPDGADIFAVKLCSPDGDDRARDTTHYLYKGECLPFKEQLRERRVAGGDETFTFRSLRSVYGPVVGRATVNGEPVALTQARVTWFDEMGSLVGYARLATPSASKTAKDLVAAVEFIQTELTLHFITKDEIAFAHAGLVPQRAKGVSGDFPVWGDGAWDWKGFDPNSHRFKRLPFKKHPAIINPKSGVIASWNNQIAPGWSVADNKWTFGPFHRQSILQREIDRVLENGKATRADIVRAHTLAQVADVTWAVLWPYVRPMIGDVDDERIAQALQHLDDWVSAGAYRADFDGDGFHENGAAIHIADAWRGTLSHAYYKSIFSETIIAEAGKRNNLPTLPALDPARSPSNSTYSWPGALMKDLAFYLNLPRDGDLSRRYCGDGDRATCRALLLETLSAGLARRTNVLGTDFNTWSVPSTCTGTCADGPFSGTSLQITFRPTSKAPALAPIPWQNRPTFEITASFSD